jgi:dihydrofolate reductase
MSEITLIAARANNGVIGRAGDIPWHVPEDLAMFKRETAGHAIIMGRKTWESLPFRPLGNRLNCVVTRNSDLHDCTATSVKDALKICQDAGHARIFGIGGGSIYRDMIGHATRMLITEVDLTISDGDAWFPDFDESNWREVRREIIRTSDPRCVLRELVPN